jgi:AraC family transcriptional regulator
MNQNGGKMEPKFKKLDDMVVVGLQTLNTCQHNVIPLLWKRFLKRESEIQHIALENVGVGVSFDIEKKEKGSEFFHIVGHIVGSTADIPEGMSYRRIPAHEYAVFTHRGPLSKLGETYDFIYEKWLPDSEFEYDSSNEIEWYDERFDPESENSEFDIYVPIKKK